MQEDVENKTLTLVVSGTKFNGRLLKAAITKYMAYRKEVKLEKQRKREMPVAHRGKQTVKQLTQQNQGVSNIDIQDKEIRQFERIARKYGVDYAVKKDRSTSPPKYMIFFKGRDADAITAAFQEYMGRKLRRETRTSVLERLEQYKDILQLESLNRTALVHLVEKIFVYGDKRVHVVLRHQNHFLKVGMLYDFLKQSEAEGKVG